MLRGRLASLALRARTPLPTPLGRAAADMLSQRAAAPSNFAAWRLLSTNAAAEETPKLVVTDAAAKVRC